MSGVLSINEKVFFGYKKFSFVVVGAGGNGSYLIRDLARIVSVNNSQYNREDEILLVDGDLTELKNLSRQNFISQDIGKMKAQVLAKRYAKAYGINLSSIDEYITEDNMFSLLDHNNVSVSNAREHCIVLIGCVDNNVTREMLHRLYRNERKNMIYIDVGNEEYAGQVVMSFNRAWSSNGSEINFKLEGQKVNDIIEHFEIKAEDKHPDELSCAEHAVSAPQNIGTNILAAETVFGLCNMILAGAVHYWSTHLASYRANNSDYLYENEYKEMLKDCPKIGAHIIYFNSRTGQKNVKYFAENIQKRLKAC